MIERQEDKIVKDIDSTSMLDWERWKQKQTCSDGRRDKGSEVPTFPRNYVEEKSKWKKRRHKTQALWSWMVEFDDLEEIWGYNMIWCAAIKQDSKSGL